MRPPEKFRTASRFCAAHQRYQGRKPEPRAYVQGLDVRTISGRRRDIFLDILFIERNQAIALIEVLIAVVSFASLDHSPESSSGRVLREQLSERTDRLQLVLA